MHAFPLRNVLLTQERQLLLEVVQVAQGLLQKAQNCIVVDWNYPAGQVVEQLWG